MSIPDGFAQVQLRFPSQIGLPNGAAVTFGVALGALVATPEQVASLVDEAIVNSNLPLFWSDSIQMTTIFVKFGPDVDGPSAEAGATFPGTQGVGPVVTPQVSILVTKSTGQGGRANRGRMYFPGAQEASLDADGLVEAVLRGNLQTSIDSFLDSLENRDIPMVVLHDDRTTTERITTIVAAAGPPTPVVQVPVGAIAATQRRRIRG